MAMEIKIEEVEPEISPEKSLANESSDISDSPAQDLKTFKCPMFRCPESFSSVDELNNHFIVIHSKPKRVINQGWAVPKEEATSHDSSDALFVGNPTENQNIGNDEKAQWPNRFGKRPKFSCCDCAFVGKDKNDINKHRLNVHLNTRRFNCTQCDFVTNRSGSLKTHMLRVHQTIEFRRVNLKLSTIVYFIIDYTVRSLSLVLNPIQVASQ